MNRSIINILDVIVIINMILGVENESVLADINGDGILNILDLVSLIYLILSDEYLPSDTRSISEPG